MTSSKTPKNGSGRKRDISAPSPTKTSTKFTSFISFPQFASRPIRLSSAPSLRPNIYSQCSWETQQYYSVPSFVRDWMPSVFPSLLRMHCHGAWSWPTPTRTKVPATENCEPSKTTSGLFVTAVTSRKHACRAAVGSALKCALACSAFVAGRKNAKSRRCHKNFLRVTVLPIGPSHRGCAPCVLTLSWYGNLC